MDAEHTERARERLREAEAEAVNRAKANGKADDEPQVDPLTPAPQLSPGAPLATARELIRRHYTAAGLRTIHHRGGDFYCWTGTHYPVADDATIRAKVMTSSTARPSGTRKRRPTCPSSRTATKCTTLLMR